MKWRDSSAEEKQTSVVLRGASRHSDTTVNEVIVRETNQRPSDDDWKDLIDLGAEPELPLKECEGDCNTDDECIGNLICSQRTHNMYVPKCNGDPKTGMDYCAQNPYWPDLKKDQGHHSNNGLQVCEGGCDSNADCAE